MSAVLLQTVSGPLTVLGGSLSMGLEGRWVAHLELGEVAMPAGAVTILFAREGGDPVKFSGTIDHGDTWQGRQKLVVFGGAGGLDAPLPFREYLAGASPVPAAQLAADVVAAAVEELDPATGTSGLAGLGVPRWTRAAGLEGSRALTKICRYFGRTWRTLDTGAIWIGLDAYPALPDAAVTFLEDRDGDALIDWAAPSAATLRPGVTVLGKKVERVTYTVGDAGAPRVQLLYRSDVDDFAAAVRRVSAPDPYALSYAATVRKQNADGSLELEVDSTSFPELRRVPYRSMNGGAEAFAGGESVVVQFLGGAAPGAFAWGCARDSAANARLALVGDGVGAGTLVLLGAGGVTMQWTPPGGSPGPAGVSVSLSGLTVTGPGHKFVSGRPGP